MSLVEKARSFFSGTISSSLSPACVTQRVCLLQGERSCRSAAVRSRTPWARRLLKTFQEWLFIRSVRGRGGAHAVEASWVSFAWSTGQETPGSLTRYRCWGTIMHSSILYCQKDCTILRYIVGSHKSGHDAHCSDGGPSGPCGAPVQMQVHGPQGSH